MSKFSLPGLVGKARVEKAATEALVATEEEMVAMARQGA